MPTSFLPEEDQGVMFNQVQLPAGATQERTLEVLKKVEDHFLENEKDTVRSIFTVAGFSFGGSGQNMGIGFVMLKDWDERNRARPGRQGDRRARDGRLLADPRGDGLRLRAAGGDRARHATGFTCSCRTAAASATRR
jgi:multidrug efflux pump subunit AcrB